MRVITNLSAQIPRPTDVLLGTADYKYLICCGIYLSYGIVWLSLTTLRRWRLTVAPSCSRRTGEVVPVVKLSIQWSCPFREVGTWINCAFMKLQLWRGRTFVEVVTLVKYHFWGSSNLGEVEPVEMQRLCWSINFMEMAPNIKLKIKLELESVCSLLTRKSTTEKRFAIDRE